MAGHSGLAEPASEPMHTEELPGVPIWRTAPELRVVRSSQGTPVFGLHSRRTRAGSSALFGQRARPSRTAVRCRSAIREGFEARAADDGGTIERLSHVEIRQFAIQLRRLGVVAARSSPGTIARGDRRFPR